MVDENCGWFFYVKFSEFRYSTAESLLAGKPLGRDFKLIIHSPETNQLIVRHGFIKRGVNKEIDGELFPVRPVVLHLDLHTLYRFSWLKEEVQRAILSFISDSEAVSEVELRQIESCEASVVSK